MRDLAIEELMSVNVESIEPATSLAQAALMMAENRYSCLVVVQNKMPVGVLTERDMVKVAAKLLQETSQQEQSKSGSALCVKDYMATPPVCINASATLFEALVLTRTHKIRHLPVTNQNQELVGLITYSDLVRSHFDLIQKQSELVESTVASRTKELRQTNEKLIALSLEDPLLGIGNRRAMEVDLEHCHAAAIRYESSYSIALLDVDYFKPYNDHYGHAKGDDALKAIAHHIQASIRKSDRLYRYGGEEMLLLMPSTELNGATIFINRLVNSLAEINITHSKSPYNVITMSAGYAFEQGGQDGEKTWQNLVKQADLALYEAKEQGRHRAIPYQAALA